MNIIEIKGIVPGAGKTTDLVLFFAKSTVQNKILLTPTNKSRQVCIQKLMHLGIPYSEANRLTCTLRRFKRNFYTHIKPEKYFDIESSTWEEKSNNIAYITKHSTKHYKKVWNIFIDEASMISMAEMDDLIDNWKIQNLVLSGDTLQFEPIGNKDILEDDTMKSEWTDEGKPWRLPVTTQILLNKSMRARDAQLQKVVQFIKEGQVVEALVQLISNRTLKDCENKPTDTHICYTNSKCRQLNGMYKNLTKFIVTHTDYVHGYYTSEVLHINDPRLIQTERDLVYEKLQDNKTPTFTEWKERYLKPAYALTCHKLQGTTIEEGDIFIHLDDILYGLQDIVDIQTRANLFQKYLYVAVSRAVSIDQINVYGYKMETLAHCLYTGTAPMTKIDGKWVQDKDEVAEEIQKLQEYITPMIDETIKEDAVQFAADDPKLVEFILSKFEYDETKASTLKGEEEHKATVSKAHSVKHKQHKRKFDDNFLKNASWEELKQATNNARIRKEWRKLHDI